MVDASGALVDASACRAAGAEAATDGSARASAGEPVLIRMGSVRPQPLEWLWPDRLPLGRVSLLVGDPGLGKSLVAIDIAARVSRGLPWPDQAVSSVECQVPTGEDRAGEVGPGTRNVPGNVLLLAADDGLSGTVRPRLDAAGADPERVVELRAVRGAEGEPAHRFSLGRDLGALERAVADLGNVRLVVIDPLTAYLGRGSMASDAEVHDTLVPLAELAERTGVAVVAVSHLNKKSGGPVVQRAGGSMAFVAAARTVWAVGADIEDPGRRVLVAVKNNVSADARSLAYRIEPSAGDPATPRVAWESVPVALTAAEALSTVMGRPPTERQGAALWLRGVLANGPMLASEVNKEARWSRLSWTTVKRARPLVGVISQPVGYHGPWVWRLPCHPAPAVPPAPAGDLVQTGSSGPLSDETPRIGQ